MTLVLGVEQGDCDYFPFHITGHELHLVDLVAVAFHGFVNHFALGVHLFSPVAVVVQRVVLLSVRTFYVFDQAVTVDTNADLSFERGVHRLAHLYLDGL